MTTRPENKDKAEQKVSKDELSDKDVEKVSGGSFDIEQTISIGSATSGAGSGKSSLKH
jgi:hypothetical protein